MAHPVKTKPVRKKTRSAPNQALDASSGSRSTGSGKAEKEVRAGSGQAPTKGQNPFQRRMQEINDQQKLAVETIEGPVLVVAGPGTGKTEVVALRVANVLQKTQMRPSNLLCLTFSNSGATAMRRRLRDIIGSDAYGVTVQTIHGFCNDVIVQHPSVFEEWSARTQISDVERYRSLNKLIDQLMPDLALVSKKSPYMRTRDLLMRISQLKKEGVVGSNQLSAISEEYDSQMAEKSKEGTKAHTSNLLKARKFREFCDLFLRYQDMLESTGRYDYDDMILHVIEALRTEDWILAGLQERYQYMFVDEFQDTNGAQYQFLELLTTDATGDASPNFFVVGDDDQAIYRFQGANLANILSFRERFPKAPVIPLTTSYRCTQPILNAAESLIEHNTERLVGSVPGLEKHLSASSATKGKEPVLLLSPSDMSEPWMVADLVEERIGEGLSPSDIAVLVQTNAELPHLYEVFQSRKIPVQLTGKIDLLSHPYVLQILAVLRAVQSPQESGLLAAALACDCFGCSPVDLARLYSARREKECSLHDLLLRIACHERGRMEDSDLGLSNPQSILEARDVILELHQKLDSRTVVDTLEHVIKECGLLAGYANGEMDILDFAAIQEFFDRITQRAHEQPSFTFSTFLSDLELYGNDEYGDLRLTYDLPHLTNEGVQLMTAHKSKGLEFHTVILTNFREGHWDRRRNPSSLSVPEDLLFGWQKDQKVYEQSQDERRVAYVAMTRAKRELIFTCPEERSAGDALKAVSPSGFFSEAGELQEEKRDVRDPTKMSTLLSTPVRHLDAEMEAFLRERIEHFSLSPSALQDFLTDPQMFVERHLLMVPQAKEVHFAYGNAVHHVLAQWAHSVQEGKPLTSKNMLEAFSTHLKERELLTPAGFKRIESLGHETLSRYFDQHLGKPYPFIHKIEYSLSSHLGDVPIKGKIDRIDLLEPNSSSAIVYDYKTGKPKTPKQIEDYGYRRQLVFYALLMDLALPMLSPKEFILEFVGEGSEEASRKTFVVSEADKKELKELIEKVWEKIMHLDFTPIDS